MGTHKLKRGHKVGGFGLVVFVFLTENLEQKYQPPCISEYTHLDQNINRSTTGIGNSQI